MIEKNDFDQIYGKYSAMLYRNAFLLTGNSQDAEDLMQDTFIIAFEHMHQLRDPDKLGVWLLRILTNLSHKKMARSTREIPDETVYAKADLDASVYQRNLTDTETVENTLYFHSCLLKVPPKQREALILYYYNDLPVKDIARICGCFPGTVKSRLSSGRSRLKEILNADRSQEGKPESEGKDHVQGR